MPIAALLLRENSSQSLKALVERAHQRKAPLLEYDLQLKNCQLELTLLTKPQLLKPTPTDEGFESDVDSLSIVSSDDSFTLINPQENGTKTTETDSANGSASSDSDTESPRTPPLDTTSKSEEVQAVEKTTIKVKTVTKQNEDNSHNSKEAFNLVDCICYTDVKFPNILVFVIKNETYVFRFDNLRHLQSFYANFSALKAVTNQKAYSNKVVGTKFNLLQRTDNNGVTHIEITRESPSNNIVIDNANGPSSIISLNTPEDCLDALISGKRERLQQLFDIQRKLDACKESARNNSTNDPRSESTRTPAKNVSIISLDHNKTNSHDLSTSRASSIDNLLDINSNKLVKHSNHKDNLRKYWNSAENLLDDTAPKRPDRRRRTKYRAPQPPSSKQLEEDVNKNILSGQFVRVNVNFDPKESQRQLIIKSHLKEPHPKKLQNFNILSTAKPNLTINFLSSKPKQSTTYQQFRYSEPKQVESATLQRNSYKTNSSWTNSVPRLLKKQRSKSETRNFTPMAYRYIDTTQSYTLPSSSSQLASSIFGSATGSFGRASKILSESQSSAQTISNRLFGLSPKLKEFGSNDLKKDRWGSMGDLCYKGDSNLKSVIKKDESRKKNEKKVTFSAYTTVQVV